jgi:hypothetical protein
MLFMLFSLNLVRLRLTCLMLWLYSLHRFARNATTLLFGIASELTTLDNQTAMEAWAPVEGKHTHMVELDLDGLA